MQPPKCHSLYSARIFRRTDTGQRTMRPLQCCFFGGASLRVQRKHRPYRMILDENKSVVIPKGSNNGLPETRRQCYNLCFAAVAQLDRVLGYEPRGRGFNSCQPHQNIGTRQKCLVPFSFRAPSPMRSSLVRHSRWRNALTREALMHDAVTRASRTRRSPTRNSPLHRGVPITSSLLFITRFSHSVTGLH